MDSRKKERKKKIEYMFLLISIYLQKGVQEYYPVEERGKWGTKER